MKKTLFLLLKGILVLFLHLLILAPAAIKYYVNENGKELCGRNIQLEDLSINYLGGGITLEGFHMAEDNDIDTFLYIDELHINPHLMAMMTGHYRVEEINIDGLIAHVSIKDTTFNFNSLIDFFASPDTATKEVKEDSSVVKYSIDKIRLNDWQVTYLDQNVNGFFGIHHFDLNIPDGIGWNHSTLVAQSSLQLLSGGQIGLDFQLDLDSLLYELDLAIDSLALGVAKPYLTDFMHVGALNAMLNTSLKLAGNFNEATNLNLMGGIAIKDVLLSDTNNIIAFAMNALRIQIDSLNPAQDIYRLSAIKIIEPLAHFEYARETDNISAMLIAPDSTLDSTATATVQEVTYDNPFVLIGQYVHDAMKGIKASNFAIDTVLLTDLKAEYVDHTLLQPFTYTVSETNLSAFDVNSNADSLITELSMLLNGQGRVNGKAILHPTKPQDVDFYLKAEQIALKDFTPFFHFFLGLPIIKGNYEMESSLKVKDRYLLSDNSVKAKSFILGKKQKHDQAYNLPVKMGVAMLKNRDGHIELSLPIEGDLADPKYKIGKVILGILKELIIKAASSPYNTIANSMQTDEESSKQISLVHIYDSLSNREHIRLDNIAQVLLDKPELALILNPYYNEEKQVDYLELSKVKADFMGIALSPEINSANLAKMEALDVSDSLFIQHVNQQLPNHMLDSSMAVKLKSLMNPVASKLILKKLIDSKLQYIHTYLLSKGVQAQQINSIITSDNAHFAESRNSDIEFHILFDLIEAQ